MVDPIATFPMRPDPVAPRRQDQAAGQAGVFPPPRLGARLQEMMQTGRETSALLSTLPGPNLSFFQAPTALQTAPGRQLNVPLLESMQAGRETSTLLSSLMGPGQRAFAAPAPPEFAPRREAPGAGAQAVPAGTLPPAGARLLETEQAGRETSTLLSGLTPPAQPGGSFGVSAPARGTMGYPSGDPLAAMRTAQEVIQAVGSAPPSAQNMRIATEAYRMEARAQRDYIRGAAAPGGDGKWEWFA